MRKSTKVVALDIHKDSITVALAGTDQKTPRLLTSTRRGLARGGLAQLPTFQVFRREQVVHASTSRRRNIL